MATRGPRGLCPARSEPPLTSPLEEQLEEVEAEPALVALGLSAVSLVRLRGPSQQGAGRRGRLCSRAVKVITESHRQNDKKGEKSKSSRVWILLPIRQTVYCSPLLGFRGARPLVAMATSSGAAGEEVPQFETTCSYVEATLEEFLNWNDDQSSGSGPFGDYDHSQFWAYADYKYFVNLFENKTDVFQDVVWSDFGFPGRNGRESTLWIGSLGAHTPCHMDSYGCNLVFQVQGRKRWQLFPPEDTPFLYPTRIPYEESSVFSKISVVNPDLKRYPQFRKAHRHMVTLNPGQVLFVPRHWWHYVESIDPVTVSINSWIELEEDHQARVEEAITRMLVCALKTAEDPDNTKAWLNPTEVEEISHEINCRYLNGAVGALFDHYRTSKEVEIQAVGTNEEHTIKKKFTVHDHEEVNYPRCQNLTVGTGKPKTASVFGPNLLPVMPSSKDPSTDIGGIFEGDSKDFVTKDDECFGKLHCIKRPRMMYKSETATVNKQFASNSTMAPPQTSISTDDLLDCLVNPQVTRIVAQLLIQGRTL
ncbi:PREDICTED: HSPB1-associated protein 1 [Chrysochloris asiatica]|uniref:HSPB1-associated protein 1 n=1 Tax=Chrysochloris asiatica TaxID=185453 RepID=A0A9B0TS93_CHRAS|nr:PREDICTED: HSPB1-associated protein 1 [Chrysochloris asiatica]